MVPGGTCPPQGDHCRETHECHSRQREEAHGERPRRIPEHAEQQRRGEPAEVRAEVAEARTESRHPLTEDARGHREERPEVELDEHREQGDDRQHDRDAADLAEHGEQNGHRPQGHGDHE